MLSNTVYMYLLGIVILFFAGNIVQWIYFRDLDEKEKANKEKKEKELKEEEELLNKQKK
jgi:uncharacterized membrane protein YhiD involved in acid resistance